MRTDGSSCFPFASEAIREIFRVSPEDVREDAAKVFAIVHPDDCDRLIASINDSAQDLTPRRLEYRVKFDDGSVRWLYGNSIPQREADGSTLWHGFITDISERKEIEDRLAQNEARTSSILEGAADAIFLTDQRGCYPYVNLKASQLLGYSYDEMLAMSIADITPAEDLNVTLSRFEKLLTTGALRCEMQLQCRNGATVPVDFSGTLLPDGTVFGSCRDITDRKRADEEREQQRDILVREVHHRIKNNLQGIAGLLHRELGKFLELDPRLQTAISQIDAMAIVHGLQGSNAGESILLCDSVRNSCRMVSALTQRPILFRIAHEQSTHRPVQVEDKEAVSIALVLNELILNAVKHSPKGSAEPSVSLRTNGTSAQVVIRNAVSGVPAFDIDAGTGLGTGLRLVLSLLPSQGAQLGYGLANGNFVHTTLTLTSPVLVSTIKKKQNLS